ncbi:uncharacterized protein N7498_001166 [Penicillium cinerascens]|uniref:Zn(2)-C6 fungal-type domain-containing protein n=1 Tax=Penicillium cinerascens TaxID=70096 RepID=A0A9W9NFS4_9EURO|nr:uncharacterized protein N7498_001166 [Penicillium cinerascens]KAJ5219067.1 hypothetical protein N7498_001166 [Penicillium cinerascens]
MGTSRRSIRTEHTDRVLIAKYRRNHKMQACEPCRKSKVSCDHSIPCGRCVRRRCVEECYYHPSPLTRSRQKVITTAAAAQSVLAPSELNSSVSSSIEQPRVGNDADVVAASQRYSQRASLALLHRAGSAPPLSDLTEISPGKHGFLGFTSHASIMTENLTQLGIPSIGLEGATAVCKKPISYERIARGCQALSFLQNRAIIDRGIDLFFESIECIHIHCGEFIVKQWLSQLWSAHGETLSSQDPEQIQQLCHLLCENTATPLAFDGSTTARQWICSATGEHIRWGVIAMIANYVGSYVMVTKSSDPFFQEFNVDRKSLLNHTAEVSDACIEFCRERGALDDTFICALFEHYNITEYTKGETCYATYCIGAEVNSALIAMGLHQEIKADSQVPFFLAELRKRLRALVYTAEISIATFLGRPPRLLYRYMNLDPPLDLTDSQLFSEDPQELAVAIAQLDEHGYNRDGEFRHASLIRSYIGFMVRREEILELSLGNYTADEVQRNADVIQRKTEEHWATLPHFMVSLRDGIFGLETQEVIKLHFQNFFRQGPQANSLLLHRVLMRKAGTGPAELIHTAQTILSDVMRLYKVVEMSAAKTFIYFLAVHGLRSAVILAIELLKQEQLPAYPKTPALSRSKTIQDLCIFTDKLSDLDTMFGDRELCEKGRKLVSRVLDKILSPPNTADRDCHHYPMPTQQPGTKMLANDMLHNTHVPGSYGMTDDFSYESSAHVSSSDHEFWLWLENIDGQGWDPVA